MMLRSERENYQFIERGNVHVAVMPTHCICTYVSGIYAADSEN